MQTTIPLTPSHPLRAVTGLARQIALPGEHAPLRFPSFPALERTALMGFNQPATLACKAGASTALTLFRQAAWPLWADRAEKIAVAYTQSAAINVEMSASTTAKELEFLDGFAALSDRLSTSIDIGLSGFLNPLAYPVIGVDETLAANSTFVYCPSGPSCYFASDAADVNITMEMQRWNSPNDTSTVIVHLTAPAGSYAVSGVVSTIPGFYRVRRFLLSRATAFSITKYDMVIFSANSGYTAAGYNTGFGTITIGSLTDYPKVHYPLVAPSEFKNSTLPWESTRLTAVAFLGTNVTQVLNKGGTILAGRVNPETQNAWTITESYINSLHPAEKSFLPMETGIYTYCPPSTDMASFYDYSYGNSPLFRLDNSALYNKVYISVPIDASLAVTASWHIEFRTSSALFQIGLSSMTLESLHQAQLVLAEAGFFFENPEHDGILRKVTALARKYLPAAAGMVNPMLGQVARFAAQQLKPKPGPTRVQATNLKASGALPKEKKKKPAEKGKKNEKKKH